MYPSLRSSLPHQALTHDSCRFFSTSFYCLFLVPSFTPPILFLILLRISTRSRKRQHSPIHGTPTIQSLSFFVYFFVYYAVCLYFLFPSRFPMAPGVSIIFQMLFLSISRLYKSLIFIFFQSSVNM